MVSISILNEFGHEEFEDLSIEEAERLIDETQDAGGQRYFIYDKNTRKLQKELKVTDGQELVMIPMIRGG